ncbi:dihydroorotase, multifunctional complex type [Parvibaculum lavamentivorans DS-1]|uniref:Dihydroorotase, multifunctional complex type n=1 Tax=Parvibaculum lavamentivorans (strain DS-1 / DSM 13023 / NCIMB 13966) TaxID=402881 RepID=A7HR40_PARL1|nr:dihydroorotase [Parvibaculum lavamentivorans]ABS62373.1 dihydroorotase, multifunctional complex type [Parvibaculum lavamentivorans DS-1]
MSMTYDLVFRGGTIVNHDGTGLADVAIKDGRIAAIGDLSRASAAETVDVKGLHILPGVVDSQVHLREPGNEHKEDLASGGRAAALGGVTSVFEMPNTAPPTTNPDAITDKVNRARHRMYCDFAFYGGATTQNVDILADIERTPGCCGIKVFMGSSTGTLLVEKDEDVLRVLKAINRRAAFHSEDEFRLRERRELALLGHVETHHVWRDAEAALLCTTRVLRLAREAGKRIHVLHISTADEMPILAQNKDIATVEVTPQHLTLAAPECYEALGTLAQMNPPIRGHEHRAGLWEGLAAGIVDVLGSDHAPHTIEEKEQTYPKSPSGMPGVQTLVPVMLNHVNEGRLSLQRFVDLTSAGPQRIFGMSRKGRLAVGYDADLTIVDMSAERTIEDKWIASKCGWTPYNGMKVKGWPIGTVVRGHRAMWEDELHAEATGEPITFVENLPRH